MVTLSLIEASKVLKTCRTSEAWKLIIFDLEKPLTLKPVLTLALLLCTLSLFPQQVLLLEKLGSGRWFYYLAGEQITFQTVSDTAPRTAFITAVSDSGFKVDGRFHIRLTEVKYIWRAYPGWRVRGVTIIAAGITLVAITSINNLTHNLTVIDPLYLGIGAGLVGSGYLLKSLTLQRYRIGNKWKLKTLELDVLRRIPCRQRTLEDVSR